MTLPLSIDQVAREIGRSPSYIEKTWPKMVRDEGFPPPLHSTRPYVWAPEHIEAWKDRGLSQELKDRVAEIRGKTPGLAERQDNAVHEQRAALQHKFGVVA